MYLARAMVRMDSYAQKRMDELRSHGLTREYALEVVSQEQGHFRLDITEMYLR